MFKIIVLARKTGNGKQIKRLLDRKGSKCVVAADLAEAAALASVIDPDCIFFDRALTGEVQTLFHWFTGPYPKFVAMRDTVDNMDSIECLNTGRFVADILYPINADKVRTALKNLKSYMAAEFFVVRRTAG